MIRYYLHKFGIFALSMLLAASIALLMFSFVAIALFRNDSYIGNGLKGNSKSIVSEIDKRLDKTAAELSVEPEMLKGAINDETVNMIVKEVAHNFIFGYATSFANSTDIYNAFVRSITEYSQENRLGYTDNNINRIAAVCVDSVNEAIGSSDTSSVRVFTFVRSRNMMIIITVCLISIIGSVIAIALLNNGIHRKYNYIGMGICTSGAALFAAAGAVNYKGYLGAYHFCRFAPYDTAIKTCFSTMFNVCLIIGALLFVAGFIMLAVNYNYFRKKKAIRMATRLGVEDTMSDYMDNYYTKNKRTHIPGEEFEKDVKKINFEE